MGDDNEIRQLIRRESESFLSKALSETKGQVKAYDFDLEFGNTKKNRSLLVVGATLATILALGAVAFGVTRVIEQRTAAAPVDVRAFDDLNLKDLLDTAKRNENDLQRVKLEIEKLEYDYNTAVAAADRDLAASSENIRARGLSSADEAAQIRAAKSASDARKANLRTDYLAASAKKKAQLAEIQKRVDQYDARAMEQANKQQALLDNAQRVFEIDKKKLTDLYEARIKDLQNARNRDVASLKKQRDDLAASLTASLTVRYNPTFKDARSVSLLSGWIAPKSAPDQKSIPAYLEREGFMTGGSVDRLDRSLADFTFLSGKIRATPYLNSVPPVLSRMESEALSSIASYRDALRNSSAGLQNRDKRISDLLTLSASLEARAKELDAVLDRYRWAVSEYVRDKREGGYLLDPRDAENLVVILNPAVPVSEGTMGYVVRGEKAVATIQFRFKDGVPAARVSELTSGESLKPFDTILVNAAQGAGK